MPASIGVRVWGNAISRAGINKSSHQKLKVVTVFLVVLELTATLPLDWCVELSLLATSTAFCSWFVFVSVVTLVGKISSSDCPVLLFTRYAIRPAGTPASTALNSGLG